MNFKFSKSAGNVIEEANEFAKKCIGGIIGTEHILYGLCKAENNAKELLHSYGIVPDAVRQYLQQGAAPGNDDCVLSQKTQSAIATANETARLSGRELIEGLDLLCAILKFKDSIALQILMKENVNVAMLRVEVRKLLGDTYIANTSDTAKDWASSLFGEMFNLTGLSLMDNDGGDHMQQNKAGAAKPVKKGQENSALPKNLLDIGTDMTERARQNKYDPVIGRHEEIERIIQILCRKTKNNPVLIGEPGVGKSAVVEGLAMAIASNNVPDILKNKILYSLDIGSIMAGTRYRGDMEEKLKTCLETIVANGNIITFIDELHTLAAAGDDRGEVKPADMLKPYLARGELQTIGATTTDEYKKYIEKDKALERRFQPIIINPPSVADTVEILKGLRENYEKFHRVKIPDEAIDAAANMSDRYIMDRFLPDKAIDLIDEAASRKKMASYSAPPDVKRKEDELKILERDYKLAKDKDDLALAQQLRTNINALEREVAAKRREYAEKNSAAAVAINADDIAEIVAKWTSIPVTRISAAEKDKLLNLEAQLHKRLIGQDEAVVSVSKAIRRARAGLKNPGKPIGSFIFLGPTGVGKTELSKALAEAIFDDENMIIRLDMSEYMESHSISKMIGSPPGYVGFSEGGQLTEFVRRKPYSVVLFDEIEKAHPDVFNILLQILDDGRLTDSQGRVVSFKNTIIIMTSNAGVADLKNAPRSLGFSEQAQMDREVDKNSEFLMSALKKKFRPEFLNRVDVIVVFKTLNKEQIKEIAVNLLRGVKSKLTEHDVVLDYSDELLQHLADAGFDPEYGARPLKRIIEQKIVDPLAEKILSEEIVKSGTVFADFVDDKVIFTNK